MNFVWHKDKRIDLLNDDGDKIGWVVRSFERDPKEGRISVWRATMDKHIPPRDQIVPFGVWKVFPAETKKFRNLADAKEWLLAALVTRKLENGL
jgi:hypothetical protein